jgi:pimeloyl-ACP methyl ester carboxylesterase
MATTLSGIISPLASCASTVSGDLTILQFCGSLNNQIDPKSSGSLVSQLIQKNGNAIDFSGLGAQAFQEALNVHIEITGHVTDAFNGASKALSNFGDDIKSLSSHYDEQLSNIKATDYAPGVSLVGSSSPVAEAARSTFMSLNPQAALIDNVISSADGNAVLQDGPSDLLGLLSSAYNRLINQAEGMSISMPPPEANNSTNQAQAQQMVMASLDALHFDVSQVYKNWGNAIHQSFSNFTSAMQAVTQKVQPYIDILNNKLTSAAAIMAMIHLISGSNEPISIVQTGPNSIMVYISGTNLSGYGEDTNIWNALGTGMGMNMPYEQDVIAAIEQYSAEHGLVNPQVTLAGHSLGGMVAQQIAEQHLFNVNQVITFGSPVMGPPVRGIKYDMYEADSDIVPLLSRYENPTLPGSLKDLAALFPARVKFVHFNGGYNIIGNVAGVFQDVGALAKDDKGINVTISQLDLMSRYLPPKDQQQIHLGLFNDVNDGVNDVNTFVNAVTFPAHLLMPSQPSLMTSQPYAGPQARLHFMDPTGSYNGAVQRVPDLPTSLGLGVHSDYEQSPWLESQKIVSPPKSPAGGALSNMEYFGMPDEYQTAQINQYMQSHSTLGQIYTWKYGPKPVPTPPPVPHPRPGPSSTPPK